MLPIFTLVVWRGFDWKVDSNTADDHVVLIRHDDSGWVKRTVPESEVHVLSLLPVTPDDPHDPPPDFPLLW